MQFRSGPRCHSASAKSTGPFRAAASRWVPCMNSAGGYAACALLFAAGILARLPGPVLWCLHSRDLFAPALARVGLHPDRIIFCETWKDAEILPAMEGGLRMRGLAGVVGELNRISLTPSRRLQLAAETSGVPALIIRRSAEHLSESNAAMTRW